MYIYSLHRMFSSMCSVGLMLNVSNMSGNVFLNYTILCLMDLVSLAPFGWLIDRLGRRSLLMVTSGVGGLACLATFLPVVLEGNSKQDIHKQTNKKINSNL